MEKGSAFFLVAFSLAAVAGSIAACSDDTTSTFNEETADAGDDGPPGTFVVDSGGGNGDGGPVKAECKPAIPVNYKPEWTAPTKQTVCTETDLQNYYDACIGSLGQDGGADMCKTWTTANAACAACVEPANNTGPIQWWKDRFYQTLNVAGCIALVQSKTGVDDCGAAFNASVQCKRDACDGCFNTVGATFTDFTNCQKAAGMQGACAMFESKSSTACAGIRNPPPDPNSAVPCFNDGIESQKSHFVRVMGITCK